MQATACTREPRPLLPAPGPGPPSGRLRPALPAGATPSGRALMKAALQLPKGLVVFPGLDRDVSEEQRLAILSEIGHPQNALMSTLQDLKLDPGDVAEWPRSQANPHRYARRRSSLGVRP